MANQISAQWQAGDVILDSYKVIGILGQSDLGEIYKVRHLGWDMELQVKSLRPEIVATLGADRIEQIVAAWIQLGLHPHLVSCYYLRWVANQPLLFTEAVTGESLRQWIADRHLYADGTERSLRRILDIATQVAWGLYYTHQKGVIHRNIQPQTVMLTADGIAKLTDFGLGTTPIVDIWGWGALVLSMFTGELVPAAHTSPLEALDRYLKQPVNPNVPPMPGQVAQALRQWLQEPPQAQAVSMLDLANQMQQIYQQVTGVAYPRQLPDQTQETAGSLNNRAVALWDVGNRDAAWQLWEQALMLQPQHPETLYNRGLILWRSGTTDDLTLLRQLDACHTQTQDGKVDYLQSLVALERGDVQTALKTLERLQENRNQTESIEATLSLARDMAAQAKQLLPQLTHTSVYVHPEITAVALSLGSRYALSASTDKTVKLWDVASGRVICTFRGHKAIVTCVAFSPGGNYILSGSEDKTIKLAELVTTSYTHTFRGHWGAVRSIAFSPDGYYFLSGSDDKTVKLWDVSRGKCLQTLRGHRGGVTAVAFSPNRRYAASISDDKTLRLWDVGANRCIRTIEGFSSEVRSIAFSPDGNLIVVADGLPLLLDATTGAVVRNFQGHQLGVRSVAFSPNGHYILTASDDQTLKLWDVATGRCLRTFEGHALSIASAALGAEGCYAVSGDAQGMRLWAVNSNALSYVAPFRLSQAQITEVSPSQEALFGQEMAQARLAQTQGDWIATLRYLRQARSQPGYNRDPEAVQAWFSLYTALPHQGLTNAWESKVFDRHTDAVQAVTFSADGNSALSASTDRTLKLWEVATGRCLRSFEGHRDAVHAVKLSADGSYALSASQDMTLKLWALATGSCFQTLRGHSNAVYTVEFSPDGNYAVSGSADRTIKLWEVATGRCLRTLLGHQDSVTTIDISPDGRFILSGSPDRTLRLWEVTTGNCIRSFEGHTAGVRSVAFSSDGRFALSASDDQTLKLWDVSTRACLLTLRGHKASVRSVMFSTDGRFALSAGEDKTIKVWDAAAGSCLRTLEAHTATVNAAAFSADGRYILSGSDDKTCKLWLLDWDLAERSPINWDERAKPYLDNFITLHTPTTTTLSTSHEPTETELVQALTRRGVPTWTEADFLTLLSTLGCAGYGWLRPEGVRQQLATMATSAAKSLSQPSTDTAFATAFATAFDTAFATSLVEPAPPTVKVILAVTEGSLKGRTFEFGDRTTCIIGRAKDCNLQLPNDEHHKTISRYHCLLDINPPAIRIRDLGSLHGTYVNGQIIGRRQPNQSPEQGSQSNFPEYDLTAGDQIQLGKTVFKVRVEGEVSNVTHFGADERVSDLDKTALIDLSAMASAGGDRRNNISAVNFRSNAAPVDAAVAELVDGYDLLNLLSRSTAGDVYLARSQSNDSLVALKIMRPQIAVRMPVIEAFLQEMTNTSALKHPHIAQLLDSGYADGKFFFVWEYCDRGSVADWVQQRGRLTIDEAMPIMLQVLDGLEHAHNAEIPHVKLLDGSFSQGRGLIHRDLKPANILLTQAQTAKIGDYGLAKAFDRAGLSGLSPSSTTAESALFMPRQQVIDFNYAKPEVDLWASAACLYYMLSGTYPRDFAGKDPYLAVLQNEPVPIRQRNPEVSKVLADVIDLALIDNPDIKYKSATALKLALQSAL